MCLYSQQELQLYNTAIRVELWISEYIPKNTVRKYTLASKFQI